MSLEAIYVEMDLPYCSLEFGVSPCTATGTPCFNTRNNTVDCGDISNFTETTLTVRFVLNNGFVYWPNDSVATFKILKSANSTGAILDPAESMGTRAKCTILLNNCKSTMAWIDQNIEARNLIASDSSSFDKGTFLGKFKATNPYIFGAAVRVYRGSGNGAFDVEHYTIDNFSGPNNKGGMSFSCVDALKLTNGDSANWPLASEGVLSADIDEVVTSFDVEPVGIGATYPASGTIAIGNEAMTFTRAGDTFTVVRDFLGELASHEAGDSVQIVGVFSGQRSSDIIYQLIDEGTQLDAAALIDLQTWTDEIDNYQSSVYSAYIVRPEPVSKLINEIVQQAGLIFWFDVRDNKIKLKVLRPVPQAQTFNMNQIGGGFSQKDNQKSRVSQVWTHYNQKDPFKNLDEPTNYFSVLRSITSENLYLTEAIRKVYSRWIPVGGQPNALDLNSRLIARYQNPPKDFKFTLKREKLVTAGDNIIVEHESLEDALGNIDPASCYVTNVMPDGFINKIQAKEFDFVDYDSPVFDPDIVIPIEQDFITDINLRELYDSTRSSLAGITSVTFEVLAGTVVGASTNQLYALTVGDFGGVPVTLVIKDGAFVVGKGGIGPTQSTTSSNSKNGGPSINADFPITIENNGTIGGGGGAGGLGRYVRSGFPPFGGYGATSGAGFSFSESLANLLDDEYILQGTVELGRTRAELNSYVQNLITVSGTVNYNCGDGGDLGQDGTAGNQGSGGTAGAAITNNANITWTTTGTILGPIL